jgi:hypothetical protein
LLQHDFIERYLLHWFAMSAHTYTRGTWTTPEATHPDRDVASTAYVSAGLLTAPLCLKWALTFEDVATRTIWIGKALPREWLRVGERAVVASKVPTRYGRLSFRVQSSIVDGTLVVCANITVAARLLDAATRPAGGLRLRLRAPRPHTGRMSAVTVGGQAWPHFDAAAETVDFASDALTVLATQPSIVAHF